ncbi:hypothetical protein A1O1_07319 [Capronia coronata CBS 617.96]|uniref:SNF2 N-terminal domain-containing protein n=1 Tax=Capronia coronata CBS 617.96 TaxID=1182541 RepID=W9Y220_9EURO|nr:uncharacterized protein A1O1_07319 [Capronia coronata CBS 617.96]EXJ83695.1 hypothetical protein A1O1_07319 [Capronia coronata CBS 617.96]
MPNHPNAAENLKREKTAARTAKKRETLKEVYGLVSEFEESYSSRRNHSDENAASDSLVMASRFAHLFHRVVCDEGHKLKNPRTKNMAAVETLYALRVWIVTATPMINRVADLLGYLWLFWTPSWLDDLEELDDYTLPKLAHLTVDHDLTQLGLK